MSEKYIDVLMGTSQDQEDQSEDKDVAGKEKYIKSKQGPTGLPIPTDGMVNDQNDENTVISSADDVQEKKSLLPESTNEGCTDIDNRNSTLKMSVCKKVDNEIPSQKAQKQDTNMFGSGKYAECLRPFVGLLLSAFGACVMAIAAVMVKRLKSTSVFVILMIRFVVMILMAILILYFRKQPIFPSGKRLRLVGRGAMGTCGITIGYFAMKHMPLGDVSIISCSATFFVCISARIFLKEPIDKLNLINILFVIGGLILIVQPPFIFSTEKKTYSEDPYALYAAIAMVFSAMLIHSSVFVIIRSLKDVHSSTILLNFGVIGLFISFILTMIFDVAMESTEIDGGFPDNIHDWLICISIGILSYAGQFALTVSLQVEAAGIATLIRKAFDIIFAYLFQIVIFQQNPNAYGIGGACLISFTLFVSGIKKILEEKLSSDHPLKTKYLKIFFNPPDLDIPDNIEKNEEKDKKVPV